VEPTSQVIIPKTGRFKKRWIKEWMSRFEPPAYYPELLSTDVIVGLGIDPEYDSRNNRFVYYVWARILDMKKWYLFFTDERCLAEQIYNFLAYVLTGDEKYAVLDVEDDGPVLDIRKVVEILRRKGICQEGSDE